MGMTINFNATVTVYFPFYITRTKAAILFSLKTAPHPCTYAVCACV